MTLSTATFISGAVTLDYPIMAVLESVLPISDEVVVNVDSSKDDGTLDIVRRFPVKVIESPWGWGRHDAGHEFFRQTEVAFAACRGDWILCIEGDEILHEDDYEEIRWLTTLPEDYAGVQFRRLYFWRDLTTLRADWTKTPLTRLMRRGRGRSRVESNNLDVDGLVWPVSPEDTPRLYHCSRTGSPEAIARRIHSVESFFHAPEDLRSPQTYDFGLRTYDSYAVAERPGIVDASVLIPYRGTYPAAYLKWLAEKRA